jgi:formate hydrogenlyase subunit 4
VSTHVVGLIGFTLSLLLAPLLPAIVNRVKAVAAGRRGQPLVQGYRDLAKLLSRGAVYSRTTSWVFRAGPVVGLAASAAGLFLVPWTGASVAGFAGDLVLFALLFALVRFATVIAALDTGSAFEGMGASREAWFGALAEPALLLALAALARTAGSLSLEQALSLVHAPGPGEILAAAALFVVFLAENARVPVDDPTTHLELTMIHEVMVLDHTGPDLAMIEYGAALKLWAFGSLVVGALVPRTGRWLPDLAIALAGLLVVAVVTGAVESTMARLRLNRVPQLLVAASVLAVLSLAVGIAGGAP